MGTTELIASLKGPILNRPTDDDLFTSPGDFEEALTRAEAYWYRQVATHYPDLLKVVSSAISSSDGGVTYALGDDHYGELEVWTPPGPPTGQPIVQTLPESTVFGFYIQGQNLKMTFAMDYSPGIYLSWVPATLVALTDASVDPHLPAYFEDAYLYRAAYYLAQKPGFIGDPGYFKSLATQEWDGDSDSMSDAGILGTLSRQYAAGGYQSIVTGVTPWYKNIP